MKKVLFFHYGPGGNAQIEKTWLGDQLPYVDFWDQPILGNADQKYKDLVEFCREKLDQVFRELKSPVSVWGHSFGCNIIADILEKDKHKIKSAIFFSPLKNVPEGFANLGRRLLKDAQTPRHILPALSKSIEDFESQNSSFWNIVAEIVKDPAFSRIYWANKNKFDKYVELSSKCPPLNFAMWQHLLNDYLTGQYKISLPQDVKMTFVIGKEDPYSAGDHDLPFWQKHAPHAKIELYDSIGHFPHLELDSSKIISIVTKG